MKTLPRILAATDLSAPARHAVDRGFRLAAEHGAGYTVMHSLELDAVDVLREWLGEDSGILKQRLETQAREAVARLLADPARNQGIAAFWFRSTYRRCPRAGLELPGNWRHTPRSS